MINLWDDDAAIRTALNSNAEYREFVQPNCTKGYMLIQVGNGYIVLYHNIDNVFTSYLLPEEMHNYSSNINDICRIAITIQTYATSDYQANCKS